jgi:hypothetical protein
MPADLDHLHAVLDRHRDVEDVLEGPPSKTTV